jgi:acyl-CoA thioesterase-1
VKAFKSNYEELAEKYNLALVPFLLDGVGGVDDMNQEDQIHPNPKGHRKVAENVWKVLKPLLEGRENTKDQGPISKGESS